MSSLVDERIVEMGFDNRNFESNVKTSMSTLDRLKSSLNFSGAASMLNKSLSSVDTSAIAYGLSTATKSFSAMEVVAITAISNITNRIVDMGIELTKSLSIDQVMTGWQKYADKTISVGTLVSQGYDLDLVNEQLKKLSWYTDETSYSFVDMVSNISKFTASGQELDSSVQAMMGIANWAALSGQNAGVASRAMYQLSQALGAGYVKLMDWRSIQNANMDTKEFRQNVLDTAVAMGTLTRSIDGKFTTKMGQVFDINQFTEYLSDGEWFTSDVLMGTLGKYSSAVDTLYDAVQNDDSINTSSQAMEKYADQLDEFGLKAFKSAQEARTFAHAIEAIAEAAGSSWTAAFEKIFGNYEESVTLWTDLSYELYDVFIEGLNKMNNVLGAWNSMGGRNDLFANTEEETGAFWNLFNAVVAIKDLIKGAWDTIFPLSTMGTQEEQVQDIANKIKKFTERLKEMSEGLFLSEESASMLSNILKGMFSIIKAVMKTIGSLWTGIQPLLNVARSLAGTLIYLLSVVGSKITDFVATTDMFERAGESIANFFERIIDLVKNFNLDGLRNSFSSLFNIFERNGGTTENYNRILNGLSATLEILKRAFSAVYDVVKEYLMPAIGRLLAYVSRLGAAFGGTFVGLLAWVGDAMVRFNEFTKTNNTFQNGMEKLVSFVQSIPSRLSFLLPYLEKGKNLLIGIWGVLKKLPSAVGGFVQSITGKSIGQIFADLGRGLMNLLSAIKGAFGEFGRIDTGGLDKFNGDVLEKFRPLTALLEGLGKLFMGLWSVLKAVATPIGQLLGYIGDILGYLGEKLSQIFSGDSSLFSIETLIDVAFWATLLTSTYRVVGIMYSIQDALSEVIGGFSRMIDSKAMMQYGEALKSLSISLLILVVALVILASIDEGKLASSLATLGIMIGLLMGMMKVMQGMFVVTKGLGLKSLAAGKAMGYAAAGMMTLAMSVMVMALAVKLIGSMDQKEMVNGIMGISMIMAVLLGAASFIGKNNKLFKRGAKGLIKMAVAVLLLSIPLKRIGSMDPDQLKQGLVGISVLVGLATAFAYISGSVRKANRTATGLIGFAAALLIATIPLRIIGGMGWEKMAVGLAGIAGITGIMITMATLSRFAKKSIGTALSMIIFSQALLVASIPLRIIGEMGWEKLAVGMAGIVGIAGVMVGMSFMGRYMKKSLVTAMGMVILGAALIEFATAIRILGSMPWESMLKAGIALIALTGILALIGQFSGTAIISMVGLGLALTTLSVGLLTLAMAVGAISLLNPKSLGKALLVLVGAFVVLGVAGYFLAPLTPVILALSVALLIFAAAALVLAVAISMIVTTLGLFGGIIGTTLIKVADGIIQASPKITQALGAMIIAILETINTAIGPLFDILETLVTKLVQFLLNKGPGIIDVVIVLIAQLLKSLAENFPTIVSSIMSMITTLLKAIRDNVGTIVDIVIDVIINLLIAIKERVPEIIATLVEVVTEIITSLVQGIITLIPMLVTAAFDLIVGIIDGLGIAIEQNAVKIRDAMFRFAQHMWNAFLSFWGINSPSRKMMDAAGHLVSGLVKGLMSNIAKAVSAIRDLASKMLNGFKDFFSKFIQTGRDVVGKIGEGLKNAWEGTKKWFTSTASSIGGFFSSKWESFKTTGSNVISKISEGLKNKWNSTKTWLTNTAGSMGGFFTKQYNSMKEAGSNIIEGLGKGVEDTWKSVSNTMDELGKGITEGFKKLFGIKSPSRVFAEIGKWIDLGLVKGMDDHSKSIYKAADSVGGEAIDGIENSGLSGAIQKMYDALNSDMDEQLVLRPVMDLTDVQNGTNQIFGMMKNVDGYSITGSNDMAQKTYSSMNTKHQSDISKNAGMTNQPNTNTDSQAGPIHNTFNITGNNPKEIAEEVSRVIQRQIDRGHAKWAR